MLAGGLFLGPQLERQRKTVDTNRALRCLVATRGSEVRQVLTGRHEDDDPKVVVLWDHRRVVLDDFRDGVFELPAIDVGGKAAEFERAEQTVDVVAKAERHVPKRADHLSDRRTRDDGEVCHRNGRSGCRNDGSIQKCNWLGHPEVLN